jgi:hypothetical protein|tara:strand:- start:1204 stop:1392 length:189 start_codon:yes stop_codon:yes gene_type:complete
MPKHYGGNGKKERKGGMKPMTDAQHKKFKKAVKDGIITKKQHDSLSAGLLEAIIKKKKKSKN